MRSEPSRSFATHRNGSRTGRAFVPTARRRLPPAKRSSRGGSRRDRIRRKSFWCSPTPWTPLRSRRPTVTSPDASASVSAGVPISPTTLSAVHRTAPSTSIRSRSFGRSLRSMAVLRSNCRTIRKKALASRARSNGICGCSAARGAFARLCTSDTARSPFDSTRSCMPAPKPPAFETLSLHAGQRVDPATGARAVPIYQTTSYVFQDSDHAAALFNLERAGHIYTRISNPPTAALHLAIAPLLNAGDHIVASASLYGGSINLLAHTLPRFGITTTFVKPRALDEFRAAIRPNTRLVIGETIGNPGLEVLDIP